MKKTLLLSLSIIAITIAGKAQESKTDSIKFKLGDYNVLLTPDKGAMKTDSSKTKITKAKKKKGTAYWQGLDLGANIMSSSQSSFELAKKDAGFNVNPAKSLYWSLNLFEGYLPLVNNRLGFVSGLGFAFKSYSFFANNRLEQTKDTAYIASSNFDYSKNKLRNFYGQIPLLLAYNSSTSNKNFHLSAGLVGNILLNSVYKLEYEQNGETIKEKQKTSNPLQIVSVDATVRVGFNNFTLFANAPMQSFYRSGTSSNLYAYTIGVQVVGFN